mmetsp:Transcript_72125/g.220830  ORF Transcript_72125/g.220830 Transcript_72125/m.220830 type:complete len:422 (+) Transcript_72125:527-1792(+)
MPSNTSSSNVLMPKASMALPAASNAFFSAIGLSSSSMAASAAARVHVSRQHELTTTRTYSRSGPGTFSSAAKVRLARSASAWPRRCGGGDASSASFTSAPSTPRSPACAKIMPSTRSRGVTFSKSSAVTSPAPTSSDRHASAASVSPLRPESFSVRTTCKSSGKISPLAFGPLCNRSFHSKDAMRRSSDNLSERAMKIDDNNKWRCRTDNASNDRKSCPNFTASASFSHKKKNSSMAKTRASSEAKKSACCIRGNNKCGYVPAYSSTRTLTAATACLVITSDSSCKASKTVWRHRGMCGKNADVPRWASDCMSCRPPAFVSCVSPFAIRGSTVRKMQPESKSRRASSTAARPKPAPRRSTSDTSSLVSALCNLSNKYGMRSSSHSAGKPAAREPKLLAASCWMPSVGCIRHSFSMGINSFT